MNSTIKTAVESTFRTVSPDYPFAVRASTTDALELSPTGGILSYTDNDYAPKWICLTQLMNYVSGWFTKAVQVFQNPFESARLQFGQSSRVSIDQFKFRDHVLFFGFLTNRYMFSSVIFYGEESQTWRSLLPATDSPAYQNEMIGCYNDPAIIGSRGVPVTCAPSSAHMWTVVSLDRPQLCPTIVSDYGNFPDVVSIFSNDVPEPITPSDAISALSGCGCEIHNPAGDSVSIGNFGAMIKRGTIDIKL